jgi:hypothetical protein
MGKIILLLPLQLTGAAVGGGDVQGLLAPTTKDPPPQWKVLRLRLKHADHTSILDLPMPGAQQSSSFHETDARLGASAESGGKYSETLPRNAPRCCTSPAHNRTTQVRSSEV